MLFLVVLPQAVRMVIPPLTNRTIAITNYGGSPIADIADVVLCSTAQGSPLLGENAAARIVQLNILDAVFVAVAQRDLEAAERNLASTMGAVQGKRKR